MPPCESYVSEMAPSVQARLITLLQRGPAAGCISLTGALQKLQALKIDDTGTLQATKEHWRWENCQASLANKGMCEAPASLVWMSTERASWDGKVLPATELVSCPRGDFHQGNASRHCVFLQQRFQRGGEDAAHCRAKG